MAVTPEHVAWAFRLILDRESDAQFSASMAQDVEDTRALRQELMNSTEYQTKNRDFNALGRFSVFADLSTHYGLPICLKVALSDYVGLTIAKGEYEKAEVAFMRKQIKPGDSFVDLGANIGFHTLIGSSLVGPSGRVFAFEAFSMNIDTIRTSLELNTFAKNVTVTQAIIGDRPRSDMCIFHHPFDIETPNSGGYFVVSEGESIPANMAKQPVPQNTLDNYLGAWGKIDFIKMDIEGSEYLAMKGAASILAAGSPIVMSEVHSSQMRRISQTGWREYFALMAGFGYYPRLIRDGEIAEEPGVLLEDEIYNVAFTKR